MSNDILARIYYEQGHKDPNTLSMINGGDREQCWDWIRSNFERNAPKVLADLFEADAWLIKLIDDFSGLCNYLTSVFAPLLPTAIVTFEFAFQMTHRWNPDCSPSDFFLYETRNYRTMAATKVNSRHVARLLELLGNVSEALDASPVFNLTRSLRNGPPVQFDSRGRIQGIHKHLQLEGYTTLRFFLAETHDLLYPLHRSSVRGAAGFQTVSR